MQAMGEERNTIQKALILEAVKILHHPTAEDVYHLVLKKHPNISKGTVYRNLKRMAKQGQILQVQTLEGPDHFDHTLTSHYHCRCVKCGRVTDVNLSYMEDLNSCVKGEEGFTVKDHEVIFTGLCPDCK